jgi:uncharacterized protein
VSDFIFPVAEILGRPGHYRDVELTHVVPGARTTLARADETAARARLRAESVIEGILVSGRVAGRASSQCARCLAEIGLDLQLEVCELFLSPGGGPVAGADDAYEVDGTTIDLEPMLRDALTLSLPLNPLCRPDCKGLCPLCGSDLNHVSCDCVVEEKDPRWSALDELRARLEKDASRAPDQQPAGTHSF